MKSVFLPEVPVEPEFLAELSSVLKEDETPPEFIAAAVADAVKRRRAQAEASALAAEQAAAKKNVEVFTFDRVDTTLSDMIERARLGQGSPKK